MSDDLVKFLQREAEEAARQASRDWDEDDEKRIAFAVLRDRLCEAADLISTLQQQLKTAREDALEEAAKLCESRMNHCVAEREKSSLLDQASDWDVWNHSVFTANELYAAIRSLKANGESE